MRPVSVRPLGSGNDRSSPETTPAVSESTRPRGWQTAKPSLPTSALLTVGFDESRTAIQLRPLTPSTTTTPRLTHALRRHRVDRGGGLTSLSGETPADTSVGVPPYLIVIPT